MKRQSRRLGLSRSDIRDRTIGCRDSPLRLRIVVSIAFLLAVAPVAALWFVGLANGSVIFGGGEAPEGLTAVLANLPWSEWAIVFIGGILIGVWTDWWFRTFDDKRRNAGKGLGAQLTRLGDELARLQFATARASDWPKNLGTARLGVMRALIRMGKFGTESGRCRV